MSFLKLNKSYVILLSCFTFLFSSCNTKTYSFDDDILEYVDNFNLDNVLKKYAVGEYTYTILSYEEGQLISKESVEVIYNITSKEKLEFSLCKYDDEGKMISGSSISYEPVQKKYIHVIEIGTYEEIEQYAIARAMVVNKLFKNDDSIKIYDFSYNIFYKTNIENLVKYNDYFNIQKEKNVLNFYIPSLTLKDKTKINFGFSVNEDGMILDFHNEKIKDKKYIKSYLNITYSED